MLISHLQDNSFEEELQSAYRAKHSTETALLKVQNGITRGLDGGKAAMLVLLDLSAAFDTIEVDILISTLSNYFGVTDLAAKWLQSYMSNKFFKVQINGKSSNWIKFQFAVPQGSILVPLLFSIYTAPIEAIL